MASYKAEIDEMRATERADSTEYVFQVVMVGSAVALAWLFLGLWQLPIWFAVVYGLSTIERYAHKREPQRYSRTLYLQYLALGTTIALCGTWLPVFLWTFDGHIYHFAALIYTVGAVLNTFVVRARAWPSLLCYVIPNGLGMVAVAILFVSKEGVTTETAIIFLLSIFITVYLVVMVRDAVVRVKQERQKAQDLLLAQKNETLANFAGGVAHDFNNLLGVISASVEQAVTEPDFAKRRHMLDHALIAVERGAGLTSQLLAVGQQSEFTRQSIDLHKFLSEFQAFLDRVIPSSIGVNLTCDPQLKSLESEPSLLQSMMLNLAINARDAMSAGGRLDITVAPVTFDAAQAMTSGVLPPGMYAAFSVQDTGHGMSSDVFGHVLEPFFSTQDFGKGAGMGLAMVVGFSQQMGGAMDIQSETDVGTRVRFFLPLPEGWAETPQQPPHAASAPALPKADAARSDALNLLLVEDEIALNRILKKHLTAQGYNVLACENGDSAYAAVEAGFRPDIVLTDIVMTGSLQGTGLVGALQQRFPHALYIVMSGYAFHHEHSAIKGKATLPCHRLAKPFKLAELDRILQTDRPAPALLDQGATL